MEDDVTPINSCTAAKVGRPSNLAMFREDWCMSGGTELLAGATAAIPNWFRLCGGYIFRAYSTDESTKRFHVPGPMQDHIHNRLAQITASLPPGRRRRASADAQLARWFEPPDSPRLKLLVPPLYLSGNTWDQAELLSRKLMYLALRRRGLVRSVVLGYCYAATAQRHVIITDTEDAEYAKIVEELVKELKIPELTIHHVGFRVGLRETDVEAVRLELGLEPAPFHHETANNLHSPARLNHLGIRLCWGSSPSATREWHHVAVLAATIELWRWLLPGNGFDS